MSPPGKLIARELEARGWSQQTLAEVMGTSPTLVSEVINAKRAITRDTAALLASAFGTSAQVWLGLEARYQASLAKPAKSGAASQRGKLYAVAPVKEMVKRGWIQPSKAPETLAASLRSFYETPSLDEPLTFLAAARKTNPDCELNPPECAWMYRSRHLARTLSVARNWTEANLGKLIAQLQRLMLSAEETRHVPKVLADFGIRFVVVEPIAKCKIDGACFWLDDFPVIAMSLRYDRIDNFWFTLMHEVAHVGRGDALSMDADVLEADDLPEQEREANRLATEALVPQDEIQDFRMRVSPLYSRIKVLGFAARLRIHPGVIVGQLHHLEHNFSLFREQLVKIRHIVTSAALTDGWGATAPMLT